ncbi:RNA 3'-terminal phosphate cyclase-like protein [Microplitis demolitor]|uniref:RNA 3'-terminal phosphate cyclase-like protein n=1 Tax=Microplitis demolitor TaxID=69319 RepID=UPI0004CCB7E1|nr:RNA 3'-terminal phosphate cyclase-like protein [Microplitis demolitor]
MRNGITYEGCNYLKQRLLLSTLSGKPVKIDNIRASSDDPGVRAHEVNLIRLLDRLTNGSKIDLNETGTSLYYSPGLLVGGDLEHDCNLERGIGYYLEAVMILAPFCKNPVNIKLRGITNNTLDPSVDRIKAAGLPVLAKFVIGDCDLDLKVTKRGAAPEGGGEVHFTCPVNRTLKPVHFLDSGMVKRIRGVACSLRVSPSIANRMVESAKGVLLKFLPDIYIHTDHCRKGNGGKSPGFGITISAETTTGVFLCGEACSSVMKNNSLPCNPEDIGKEAAMKLLDEIYRNGCVDSVFQRMAILFMALGKKDVSKVLVGPLSQSTIQFLRDLKDFFGIIFKLDPARNQEDESILDQVVLTCTGIGYSNLSRRVL